MVKTKDGTGIWPAYTFSNVLDANKKPFGQYRTWIPVDEGYYILLDRKYYYDLKQQNPYTEVFQRFYKDVHDIEATYDPDEWKVACGKRNILMPASINYLD